jgi:F-type H+-transporting ATPase subunit b
MQRQILIAWTVVGLGLCFACPTLAQSHGEQAAPASHADDGGHGDAAGGEAHGGDHGESFGLLTIDTMTAISTIVVFVALLAVLGKVAWKPVQDMLVQREQFIENSLRTAKTEREDAQELLAKYTEQIQKAREEASVIVEEGRRDAEAVKRRIEEETRANADAMTERAKRDIEIARDTAVKSLYDLTAKLATDVAGRIIEKELTASDHERLVKDSINELANLRSNSN